MTAGVSAAGTQQQTGGWASSKLANPNYNPRRLSPRLFIFNLQTRSTLRRQRGVEENEEDEEEEDALEPEEDVDEVEQDESEREDRWRSSRQSYAAQFAEMRRRQK